MSAVVVFLGLFLGAVFVITTIASSSTGTLRGFFIAHRTINGVQNGFALAGDYLSAASFLGVTGLIAFYGYDGFFFVLGWLMSFVLILLLVAEPLRNVGRFTIADAIAARFRGRGVRALVTLSSLCVILVYLIAQMVGAGTVARAIFPALSPPAAIALVGGIMLAIVVGGGMLATTWVQIVKTVMLLLVSTILVALVFAHFHFSLPLMFAAASTLVHTASGVHNLLQPGHLFVGTRGALDRLSLGLALVLGAVGLPHILVRFYTVPHARAARLSVLWAIPLIGIFYLMTLVMGVGAATIVGQNHIGAHLHDAVAIAYISNHPAHAAQLNTQLARFGYIVPHIDNNYAGPLLASMLGGPVLFAFFAAVAFATILAVTAGLTITGASAIALDVWQTLIRGGAAGDRELVRVGRFAAVALVITAIVFASVYHGSNVALFVGLSFAIAASAHVPSLLCALFWKRFTAQGAVASILTGLGASITLVILGPALSKPAIFPLLNPGIVSIPLGFLAAILGSLLTQRRSDELAFTRLSLRANTGIGADH